MTGDREPSKDLTPKKRRTRGVRPDSAAFKAIRRELGLLKEAVAVYTGLSVTTVRKMETGQLVDADSVRRAAVGLSALTGRSITYEDLLGKDSVPH